MPDLAAELTANFDAFTAGWTTALPKAIDALGAHKGKFVESYSRIASLNAWRANVLEAAVSDESLAFFAESINDAIVSHVLARTGCWRSALMSLRSCIENVLYCIYYKDHPVELRQWLDGKHRLAFSEASSYLESHPDISSIKDLDLTGLPILKSEYSTLSRAVHASGKSFRMSPSTKATALWKPEVASLGKWSARERLVLCGLNLLLTSLFREDLSATRKGAMRQSLAFAIPSSYHAKIKSILGVTVVTS